MKRAHFLIAAVALVFASTSCTKKGENDPFLSLKSRDSRITGTWNLSSSTYTSTSSTTVGGTTTTSTFTTTYDGTLLTTVQGQTTNSSTYSQELIINKDGTYSLKTTQDGDITEGSGYWWWLNDSKKKTRLALDDDWNSFDISQLKNKEMILTQDTWMKDTDSNGDIYEDTDSYTTTWTKSK